jgi:CHRD domain
MRKRRWFGALIFAVPAALAVATFAVAGDGGKSQFKADTLTGYQEAATQPISTTGTGSFEASLNDAGDEISYTLAYSDLEGGAVTAAHIHFGQRAINGGVIAFLCGGSTKPACPASPATVTGTITSADIIGPNAQGIEPGSFAEAVRALRAGMVYANVHTTRWPSGEIRGQINDQNQRSE